MKKYLLKYLPIAALIISPAIALAEHPEGNYTADIQSQIRDDYRQLSEDRNAGFTDAVAGDEKQIADDKARLRDAEAHPHRAAEATPPRRLDDAKPAANEATEVGDQVTAEPPSEHEEWKPNPDKLDPNNTFNHSASVDDEIR